MTGTEGPTLATRWSARQHSDNVAARALLTDLTLVVVLMAATIAQERHHQLINGGTPSGRIALGVLLILPLIWRRRAPLTAFAVIAALAFAQWLVGPPPILADVALLCAFYSVAAWSPTRRALLAGGVLELGVVLAIARYGGPSRDVIPGFLLLSGLVTAAGALGGNVRIRSAYLTAVEQRAAQLEFERDQQAQLAVADERRRIAREMHDVIAHNLTVMVALTDGAALTLSSDPGRAAAAVTDASAAGRAALRELRRVLGVLRDNDESAALAPSPSIADLDALLETVRRTGVEVSFRTQGPLDGLGEGLELTVYRLIQEALTNTVKHAVTTSRIDVRLASTRHQIALSVRDDGQRSTTHRLGSGQGLAGMRERVAVHAGRVEAGKTTAGGWEVKAWLPVTSLTARSAADAEPVAAAR